MNALLPYKTMRLIVALLGLGVCTDSAAQIYKDPTMPLVDLNGAGRTLEEVVEEQEKTVDLHLQSVIFKNGKEIAIINNQMVRVGQVIEGYTVTEIIPYGAKLRGESDKVSLTLLQVNIKTKR
jgi:hypothetical protein